MAEQRGNTTEPGFNPALDGNLGSGDPLSASGPSGKRRGGGGNGAAGQGGVHAAAESYPAGPDQGRGGYGDSNLLPATEVHLLDYVRVLYKRRFAAITAFLVVVVSVVVYTFTQTPIYSAHVQLLIEPENPNVISFKEVIEQDKSSTDYYQTQYKILQSRALAKRTIEAVGLWNHPDFAGKDKGAVGSSLLTSVGLGGPEKKEAGPQADSTPGGGPKPANVATANVPIVASDETPGQSRVIEAFLKHITVSPIRNSRLVDVTFESTDAQLAARAANAMARSYIEQNLEYRFLSSKEASDWLGQRLGEQRKQVESSEQALQRYKEQTDAVSLEDKQNIVVQTLAELNAAVTKARTERLQKEALYNQIQSIQHDRAAIDTFPAILSNTFIQQMKGQLAELQRQQASLGEKYGEKHPEMIRVKSAIEQTDAKLQGEIGKVVASMKNEYLAAQSQEQRLVAALERQKSEAMALSRKGIDYGVLQRDANTNRQMFDSLLQRAKETGVSAELKTSNIRVVDAAEVPARPTRPNKTLNLLLAVFGGGLCAAGLAFFFEYIDNRVKNPDEIKNYLGLPFLGLVPRLSDKDSKDVLIHTGAPTSFSEAFRNIRTNVLFSSADEGGRSIVVTSTGPGEGKTMIAGNLAVALAQAGQRVILVDADMRKPKVHTIFKETQAPGLSNVLVGNAKASEAVRKTPVQNLWLLVAGVTPPNPAELLGSHRFRDFLTTLQEHFDWVIVDTPPVMAVTDASVVGHTASGVLFVIACEQTSKYTASAALEQLEAAKARFLGGVLNKVDVERHSYYYSHYYRRDYGQYYHSKES
ncbi:MAG TPA: polysaccharide biosynthesis tyrosine autokinase [Vicinamibacterales bacterium]|jgi:capsular exopolysaccharide synthesis family protein